MYVKEWIESLLQEHLSLILLLKHPGTWLGMLDQSHQWQMMDILTIIDYFPNWAEAITTPDKAASSVATS